MTAEVEKLHDEVEVEVIADHKGGLDTASCQDLPNGTNHTGNGDVDANANANPKDDADGSYVFVNGEDAVADDPVESDLNGSNARDVGASAGQNVHSENGVVEEQKVENGEIRDCVGEENAGGNDGPEDQNGITAVAKIDSQQAVDGVEVGEETRDSEAVTSGYESQLPQPDGGKGTNGQEDKRESEAQAEPSQSSLLLVGNSSDRETQPPDQDVENVEGQSTSALAIDIEQNQVSDIVVTEDIPDSVDHENQPAGLDQGKDEVGLTSSEIPLESQSGDEQVYLEHSLQIDSSHVAELQGKPEAVGIPVSNENGDGLTADNAPHNSVSQKDAHSSVSEKGSQETPEQDRSSEKADSLSNPVLCENLPVENPESFSTFCNKDTRVEATSQGPESDLELDLSQVTIIDIDVPLQAEPAVEYAKEDCLPMDHAQGNVNETVAIDDADAKQNTVGEARSLSFTAPVDDKVAESDVEISASKVTENSTLGVIGDVSFEVEVPQVKCIETTGVETEGENGCNDNNAKSIISADGTSSETETGFDSLKSEDGGPNFPRNNVAVEEEVQVSEKVMKLDESQHGPLSDTLVESHEAVLVENEIGSPSCLGDDVKMQSEAHTASGLSKGDIPGNVDTIKESQVLNGSKENCVLDDVYVKNGVQHTDGDDDGKTTCQEVDGIKEVHKDEPPAPSPEGSTVDVCEGQSVGAETEKRPFYFLIRIPRYDVQDLREQIRNAQLQVDQKTGNRDAIGSEIQKIRASCKEYSRGFDTARAEENAARDLLRSKRQEIDSLQSIINRVKSAISIDDIDGRVRNMEHMIEHETLPLKEEKQLIREIKQLKQLRDQISSNMGRQDDVQQALDQKDQIEERSKLLRKEADLLRDNVLKAEAVTKAAKKKYDEEAEKKRQLDKQFKAANDIRQEVYAHLQSLRKQAYEKNVNFRSYMDDANAANDLALKGDKEALQQLCINQVERVMNMWNNDDEFRKEYVRCNVRSTLRRLRTLDGRSLGPDEVPVVIPYSTNGRVEKDRTVPVVSPFEGEKQEIIVPLEDTAMEDKPTTHAGEQKKPKKAKKPTNSAPVASVSATVSNRDEIEEVGEEEHKRTREEEELARKAEELRKAEEAVKLKEQRKLEEKAKAKEALVKKKRNADKAQARAAARAQKEAEQKEKEREKKLRKKERRKTVATDEASVINEEESAGSLENSTESQKEAETTDKPMTVTHKNRKPSQFIKQTKAKSVPMPIRNRGKRRMQPWMWVLLTAVAVIALFLLGNGNLSFKARLPHGFNF